MNALPATLELARPPRSISHVYTFVISTGLVNFGVFAIQNVCQPHSLSLSLSLSLARSLLLTQTLLSLVLSVCLWLADLVSISAALEDDLALTRRGTILLIEDLGLLNGTSMLFEKFLQVLICNLGTQV